VHQAAEVKEFTDDPTAKNHELYLTVVVHSGDQLLAQWCMKGLL
jgi:hypothetical protein